MTWCCRANMVQLVRGVIEMKKAIVKKYINPMTGKTEQYVQVPNVFIYGLTEKEKEVLRFSLPAKDIDVTDITGQATDIVMRSDFALIINPDNISDDEMQFFEGFYKDFDGCTEPLIFTKYMEELKEKFQNVKIVLYKDEAEMKIGLKFELMKALNKTNRADNYYSTLSQIIRVLFAIRNKPYITTKELAGKIERSTRTVQRYIETLRCSGEFIGYDRAKNGWYLMIDGKSVLMDEF